MSPRRALVAGAGAVGTMIADLLRADGYDVTLTDPNKENARLPSDIAKPDVRLWGALQRADTVVLAVPTRVALAAIPIVAPCLDEDALLVETLSVKTASAHAIASTDVRCQAIGINPLFSPDLPPAGRPVAAVVHRPGPRTSAFTELMGHRGCRVVPLAADQHDRLSAATQALVHAAVLAFGLTLSDLGLPLDLIDEVATPPAEVALALLARIGGGTPEVYWDVQSANPYGPAARNLLASAVSRVGAVVDNGTEDDFAKLMRQATMALGDRLGDHRATAIHLFTGLSAR